LCVTIVLLKFLFSRKRVAYSRKSARCPRPEAHTYGRNNTLNPVRIEYGSIMTVMSFELSIVMKGFVTEENILEKSWIFSYHL